MIIFCDQSGCWEIPIIMLIFLRIYGKKYVVEESKVIGFWGAVHIVGRCKELTGKIPVRDQLEICVLLNLKN